MEAVPSTRPDPEAGQAWIDEGLRANVKHHDLTERVRLKEIPIEWRRAEGGPFTNDGGVKQGYLFHLSDKFAAELRQRFPQLNFPLPLQQPDASIPRGAQSQPRRNLLHGQSGLPP